MTTLDLDLHHLRLAILEAHKSPPIQTAYCVGALLTKEFQILATGYSRELPGNTHAEECCLLKLSDPSFARGATIYTTMEPCNERLSGKTPCAQLLLKAGVARVVMGVKEPPNFVAACTGAVMLRDAGVVVDYVKGLEVAMPPPEQTAKAPAAR
ncbi:DRAP deaminase [Rhizophlyctis rosea]|uniref:DRAP deaminase n=1 Tax=Rhizophlyctis rosea TaxID=64517 RepID=A0AAD5WYP9_9FUNG|nr:DRAP deaminase [Rhizophlyctis rosea]